MSKGQVSEVDARSVIAPLKTWIDTTSTTAVELDLSELGENPRYLRLFVTGDLHFFACGAATAFTLTKADTTGFDDYAGCPVPDGGEYSFVYDPKLPFFRIMTDSAAGKAYLTVAS